MGAFKKVRLGYEDGPCKVGDPSQEFGCGPSFDALHGRQCCKPLIHLLAGAPSPDFFTTQPGATCTVSKSRVRSKEKKKKKKRKVFRGERSDLEGGLPAWAQWPDVFLPRRGVFFGPPHPAALIRTLNTSHWRLYFGLLLELRVRVSCSKAHPILIFSDFSSFSRKKKKEKKEKYSR